MDGESSQQPSSARTSSAPGTALEPASAEASKPAVKSPSDPHLEAMTSSALAEPSVSTVTPEAPAPLPEAPADEPTDQEVSRPAEPVASPGGGFFHADKPSNASSDTGIASDGPAHEPLQPLPAAPSLEWVATGAHVGTRSKTWYTGLIFIGFVIAALVYLVTRDLVSPIVIALCAPLFGYISTKKPHDLHYRVDKAGITIGAKHYLFQQFRAFALVDEGGQRTSIVMMPLQRFAPMLSVSYDPEMQSSVVEVIASHLPLQEYKRDAIDQITSRLKF